MAMRATRRLRGGGDWRSFCRGSLLGGAMADVSPFDDLGLRKRLLYAVIALLAAWFVNIGFTSTGYVNCRLTSCGWFDIGKIAVGLAALSLAWNDYKQAQGAGRDHLLFLVARTAIALAAIYMLVHGAGLVGPAPCPAIKPNC
jgi:hypothetical protein